MVDATDLRKARTLLAKLRRAGRLNDPTIADKVATLRAIVDDGMHYSTRKNRRTGFMVSVATAEGAGMAEQDEGIHYYAICEEHGTLVGTETRAQADSAAAAADFCDDCRAILWPSG